MTYKNIASLAYKKSAKMFFIKNHFLYRISLLASVIVIAAYFIVAEKPSGRFDYYEMLRDQEKIKEDCLIAKGMDFQHIENIRKNCFIVTSSISSKFEECRSKITDLEVREGIYASCEKTAFIKAHTSQRVKKIGEYLAYYGRSILSVIALMLAINHIFPLGFRLCALVRAWINAGRSEEEKSNN